MPVSFGKWVPLRCQVLGIRQEQSQSLLSPSSQRGRMQTIDTTEKLLIREGFSDKVVSVQIPKWGGRKVTGGGRAKYKALRWKRVHGTARWPLWLVADEQGEESECEVRKAGPGKPHQEELWRPMLLKTSHTIWIIGESCACMCFQILKNCFDKFQPKS